MTRVQQLKRAVQETPSADEKLAADVRGSSHDCVRSRRRSRVIRRCRDAARPRRRRCSAA
jgi:hypothetical protein